MKFFFTFCLIKFSISDLPTSCPGAVISVWKLKLSIALKIFFICFNPEFLVERTAIKDFENTDTVILGGVLDATTKLKQFYSKIFPNAYIIKTDSTTAELVKYLILKF